MIDSSEMSLVFDIEANNLLEKVNKLWCIYAINMETEKGYLFHDYPHYNNRTGVDDDGIEFTIPKRVGSFEDGVKFLNKAKQLICHNIMKYDQPLLKKFFPYFKERFQYPLVRDTLIESQLQFFNRAGVKGYKGKHGLAPWGGRLKIFKPEVQDWSFMDIFKINRCIEDVKINQKLAHWLIKEQVAVFDKCDGIDFTRSLEIEHEFAYWASIQEKNGAKIDLPHLKRCLKYLDRTLENLKEEIEPLLPPVLKPNGSVKLSYKEICKKLKVDKLPDVPKVWKRSEKIKILEFNRSNLPYRDKPNKVERIPNRPFATPTTKYTKTIKYKSYIAKKGNLESPYRFDKVKEARQWVKDNYLETKGWKYPSEERSYKLLNSVTCDYFGYEPTDIHKIGGAFTKISITPSTLGQDDVVKNFLLDLGWIPLEYNYKTDQKKRVILDTTTWEPIKNSPKLTEKSYKSLPDGLGLKIATYNTLAHRRTYLKNMKDDTKGLMNNIRDDGRITCGLNTYGTVSGRS